MDVRAFLSNIEIGPTSAAGPLRIVRLVSHAGGPEADLLDESLPAGRTTVSEVGLHGIVGRVFVEHAGKLPLLLLDGEQIVGAKQNRIVNASFLIQPGLAANIPVSCVEQRRWEHGKRDFGTSDTTVSARLRASKHQRVCRSLQSRSNYDADQRSVWSDVDGYLERTGTFSITSSFDDAYRSRRQQTQGTLDALNPVPNQVGLAVVLGERLLSLDVFGSPSLYGRAYKKIARGILAEEYDRTETASAADAVTTVRAALSQIAALRVSVNPAPGGGETVHGRSHRLSFTGIVGKGALYHAMATETA